MKMQEKYIIRRTVAMVLIVQAFILLSVGIFLYGIMH